MKLESRPITDAVGAISVHNIAFPGGKLAIRKGTCLTESHLETLRQAARAEIEVAVLDQGDIAEDEAAQRLAEAIQTEYLHLSRTAGGRINFRAAVDGLLVVDPKRLRQFNLIPGLTLATRAQHAIVGPHQENREVATLKIIPYAVPQANLAAALELVRSRPGIIELRPIQPGRRIALLLTGEPAVQAKLRRDFEPPIRKRLERFKASLSNIEVVSPSVEPIRAAVSRLMHHHDLLIIAGQTSIMDLDDLTLRALRAAGADVTVHGAPVEPGNLLALAYFPHTPVICAPGCVRGSNRNVVDLVLPRLLLGDRLGQAEIAELGLGGLLY